ncbi:HAMP domain-containing protein [Micromonospora sp. CPCC 205371]|nr:HAMP domain-containing protein [Micromonospora sp. CPCC 205371]
MSFRLRVLGLVMLVALTAIGATAWLTLRQASEQLTESATADQEVTDLVHEELLNYARTHGTWEQVPSLLSDLGQRTGQRLHLATEFGEVVADTDQLNGRTARELGTTVTLVDPRPVLTFPEGEEPKTALLVTLKLISNYRYGVRLAACQTRNSAPIDMNVDSFGVPSYRSSEMLPQCGDFASESQRDPEQDQQRVNACLESSDAGRPPAALANPDPVATPGEESLTTCLARVFTEQVSDVSAVPLRVTLGVGGEPSRPLSAGPMLVAAAGVAIPASAGPAPLSRRVRRPTVRPTEAAGRLGRGDLASRVSVSGGDEVAELGRSFNRMADSLQRAEERQRRLVADVAHELRTPLANLRGYLEALKDGVIAPDTELFASLHEEAVLQQRIVNDLQDLALAEAGTLAYHRVVIDLAELLETARTAHLAVAETAGVRLAVAVHEPVLVNVDPDRMRQVFGNLISNAIRATAAGGSVTLTAGHMGGSVVVRVADTGTGIPAEALPNVFDRFWRGDQARGRRTGGSGLGLAIVRQIVTDHHGTIVVASQVGVGTTFTLTLPPVAGHVDAESTVVLPQPSRGW